MAATEVNVYKPGTKELIADNAPKVLKELQFGVLYICLPIWRGND